MTAGWLWPQWSFAVIFAFSGLAGSVLHGRPRSGAHNGFLGWAVIAGQIYALYAAGFWR